MSVHVAPNAANETLLSHILKLRPTNIVRGAYVIDDKGENTRNDIGKGEGEEEERRECFKGQLTATTTATTAAR